MKVTDLKEMINASRFGIIREAKKIFSSGNEICQKTIREFQLSLSEIEMKGYDPKYTLTTLLRLLNEALLLQDPKNEDDIVVSTASRHLIFGIMELMGEFFNKLQASYSQRWLLYEALTHFEEKIRQGNIRRFFQYFYGHLTKPIHVFWLPWNLITLSCLQSPLVKFNKTVDESEARWIANTVMEYFQKYEATIELFRNEVKLQSDDKYHYFTPQNLLVEQKTLLKSILEKTLPAIKFCLKMSKTSQDYEFCNAVSVAVTKYQELFSELNLSVFSYLWSYHIYPTQDLLISRRELLVKNALCRQLVLIINKFPLSPHLVIYLLEFLVILKEKNQPLSQTVAMTCATRIFKVVKDSAAAPVPVTPVTCFSTNAKSLEQMLSSPSR